jgi:hypothetical protein
MRVAALLSFTVLLAGCHGAYWDKTAVPAPATAARDGTPWSQYCTYHGASDLTEINAWLQWLGQQGWELAGIGGNTATVYCFKSRVASAPPTFPGAPAGALPGAPVPPPPR